MFLLCICDWLLDCRPEYWLFTPGASNRKILCLHESHMLDKVAITKLILLKTEREIIALVWKPNCLSL